MRASSRGFSLPEMMVTLAMTGAFGATLTAVSMRVNDEQKAAVGRQADLDGLRRAARALDDDLRAGLDPEVEGWRLYRGELIRDREVMARSVAVFELLREGDLWHVRIGVKPRAAEGAGRDCLIAFSVRARVSQPKTARSLR